MLAPKPNTKARCTSLRTCVLTYVLTYWEAPAELSPLGFCDALALKKGYRIARGRGGADTHRAGLEVRRDCYAQPLPDLIRALALTSP
jgi:hypothetical protein